MPLSSLIFELKAYKRQFFLLWMIVGHFLVTKAQPKISLGPTEIPVNQPFTITVSANEPLKGLSNFPDIQGLLKAGTSSSTESSWVNGQVSATYSLTQNYIASKQGTYKLPAFVMSFNGVKIRQDAAVIKVVAATKAQPPGDPFGDPFADLFEREQVTYYDVKDDAFLGLTSSKNEVFVGEGFTLTLAFYVAETNRAELQFFKLAEQLGEILKKIKPANAWEENFGIEEIQQSIVIINGKKYTRFKIFEAAYFPINPSDIALPPVALTMLKFKEANQPTLFRSQYQQDYKDYYTQPLSIKVKPLPPHPLKDRVSVGRFRLLEALDKTRVKTGQSVKYGFTILGEGNFASVKLEPQNLSSPEVLDAGNLQNISRANGRVTGKKLFNFYLIPREPGSFNLKDVFQWVYFDPYSQKYDTLKAQARLTSFGESQKSTAIRAQQRDDFYQWAEKQSNTLFKLGIDDDFRFWMNILLSVLGLAGAIFIFRKRSG